MTETQEILRNIAALRARLDRAHGLMQEADGGANEGEVPTLKGAEVKVNKSAREGWLIDSAMRPLSAEGDTLPPRLTARAMRLLHQGRHLLQGLRKLVEDPAVAKAEASPQGRLHRETAAMLEAVLRTVQSFPPSPSGQLRLCEGLEAVLEVVAERVSVLRCACLNHQKRQGRVDLLARLFRKLTTGQAIRNREWHVLTEEFWKEARQNERLRFYRAGTDDPFRFAAAHGMNVAQVLARLLIHEPEWQGHLHDCLLAALVHDIGMVYLPADVLALPAPWGEEQRRRLERHPVLGAQVLAKEFPPGGLVVEATQDHQERLDGTGYPAGKRDLQVSAFTRLLAVCDVYAALCCGRPHRPALDTRTALTDTLLLADKGVLDKFQAEKLLRLSFYPVGTVVELADGAVGVVALTHVGEKGLLNPSKPVLLLITESDGQPLPAPRVVDLMQEEDRSILRTLPPEARQSLLGRTFPEMI